jgi:hypothetical protein
VCAEEAVSVKAVRRIGKTPAELGNTTGVSGSPDILELEDGSFAIIGVDITEKLGRRPLTDSRCADTERIVHIPRNVLISAKNDIPAD